MFILNAAYSSSQQEQVTLGGDGHRRHSKREVALLFVRRGQKAERSGACTDNSHKGKQPDKVSLASRDCSFLQGRRTAYLQR